MNQPFRIMIIDDDMSLLRTVENIFISQGYIVSLAKSGKQALNALSIGNTPDLILLDIAMPEMDGYATFKEIKAIQPNVPIIFLTSMEDLQAELTALELGAIDYITKPFVTDILLARVRNHLEHSRKLQKEAAQTDTLKVKLDKEKIAKMQSILTEAELEVGKMIALGYTNQEIADELNYSYNYVKKLAYRIFDKLNVSKRHELRWFFVN